MPILPFGRPFISSSLDINSSAATTSAAESTLGKRIAAGPAGTISSISCLKKGVSRPFTRTIMLISPKSKLRRACFTSLRAASFSEIEIESSRSKITASAP